MKRFDLPKGVKKDRQTVTVDRKETQKLPEGIKFREAPTQIDERGSLCEIYDPRWKWHKDPLVYVYFITLRPGLIKGWNLHLKHEDRYFVISGDMEVVLYDARKNSKTYGLVSKVYLTEYNRRLMNIPAGVWHADRNVGSKDVIMVNLPTSQYNYKNPEKYRLPVDTDKIPYKFVNPVGG